MTVRTTSKMVTFTHPFILSGAIEAYPAGTYTVETDEELLQPSSFPAYRWIATLLRLERNTGTVLTQIVETNPVELAGALARDRTAARNSAATGSQRSCRVSEKGAWLDEIPR